MKYSSKKTIMPFVVLYEGVFDNIPEILNMLKESNSSRVLAEWEPWYELGHRTRLEHSIESDLSEIEKKQLEILVKKKNCISLLLNNSKNYLKTLLLMLKNI
jgi:hypothetical protein